MIRVSLSGGRLTVTSSHSPGSHFPVGETLVQYTATDAAGNGRTCNLTITVQGTSFFTDDGCDGSNHFTYLKYISKYIKITRMKN